MVNLTFLTRLDSALRSKLISDQSHGRRGAGSALD
jgi:hypothetical protein